MFSEKASKIYLYIVKAGICLALFMPLLVSSKFLFPFIFPKIIAFRIIIEVVLFFYLLLILAKPSYLPKLSKAGWMLAAYIAIIFISSIFGADFYNSFWSNVERSDGLLTIIHFFIFFLIVTSVFKRSKDWLLLLNVAVIASVLVCVTALVEYFGVKNRFFINPQSTRLSGSLGNSAFLAGYMLFNIIFASILLFYQKHKFRIFYFIPMLFYCFILYNTQTRGAILSFVFGIFLFLLFNIFNKKSRFRKYSLAALVIMIISIIFIFANKNSSFVQNTTAIKRIASISLKDTTTETRMLNWKIGWQGWKDKPVFGWGYENFNIVFNKYFPPQFIKGPSSELWFDRAHNSVVDVAVASGTAGLLSYLALFITAFYMLWAKFKSSGKYKNVYALMIIILVMYIMQNIFVFDTPTTYLMFFLSFAFINYLLIFKEGDEILEENNIVHKNINPAIFIIIFLFISSSVYIFNIRPILANSTAIQALSSSRNSSVDFTLSKFKKSLDYDTYQNAEISQQLINFAKLVVQNSDKIPKDKSREVVEYTIESLNNIIDKHHLNVRHHYFLMMFYNSARKFDANYSYRVLELGEEAIKLSPTRPHLYFQMAEAKIFQQKISEAIELYKKGLSFNDEPVYLHWPLLSAYIYSGEDEEAIAEFAKIKELGIDYNDIPNLTNISKIYLSINKNDKAAEYYSEISKLYKKAGKTKEAEEYAKKAIELNSHE
ncbi:O-antigen ligase family protein [Candidatus Parcubacteria bacterium]|nr:O-antigen ligase family protein [Candidatus Parcubacteria bacterium]